MIYLFQLPETFFKGMKNIAARAHKIANGKLIRKIQRLFISEIIFSNKLSVDMFPTEKPIKNGKLLDLLLTSDFREKTKPQELGRFHLTKQSQHPEEEEEEEEKNRSGNQQGR
jgi:hypothetical protein